jgi:hypothetical protein
MYFANYLSLNGTANYFSFEQVASVIKKFPHMWLKEKNEKIGERSEGLYYT